MDGGGARPVAAAWALTCAGAALAQSAAVSPYGNLDVSIGSLKRNVAGEDLTRRAAKLESGVLSGSFVGLKGLEDLGGGLAATFKLECAVGADAGAVSSPFWDRTSEVGLTGPMGALTLGNSLSLSFRTNLAHQPFTVLTPLGLRGATNFVPFQKNTATYQSPVLAGMSAVLQYGADETSSPGSGSISAVQIRYDQGALAGALTHTEGAGHALWQGGGRQC